MEDFYSLSDTKGTNSPNLQSSFPMNSLLIPHRGFVLPRYSCSKFERKERKHNPLQMVVVQFYGHRQKIFPVFLCRERDGWTCSSVTNHECILQVDITPPLYTTTMDSYKTIKMSLKCTPGLFHVWLGGFCVWSFSGVFTFDTSLTFCLWEMRESTECLLFSWPYVETLLICSQFLIHVVLNSHFHIVSELKCICY